MREATTTIERVSIVIPVYNTAWYLPRVIGCIQQQTCDVWELILVDDGSRDDSGAICDRYAQEDPRIRVIHTPNGGPSAARNVGLEAARYEWVLFVDSDDRIAPDALEKLLANSAGADVVIGHFPGQTEPWRRVREPRTFLLDQLTDAEMEDLFFMRMFHSPINKLLRRERIRTPFRTDVTYIDDVTFLISNFAYWKKVVVLPDDTYFYDQRPDSLTHAFRIDRLEQVRTSVRLFRELFADGSLVMDVLSRWYVTELWMYMKYYTGGNVPQEIGRMMILLALDDEDFDHGRISTRLLRQDMQLYWNAVISRDAEGLLRLLPTMK